MTKFEEAKRRTGEYGVVTEVRHPLVLLRGLPGAKLDEIVIFDNDQMGNVLSLAENHVEVMSLSASPIRPGTEVSRTGRHLTVPVGEELRGKIVDPLGNSLWEGDSIDKSKMEERVIDVKPLNIQHRAKITKGIVTGTGIVDMMLPLGAGQREAILGEQKTGKTLFLLATAKEYAKDHMVIYTAIGKPWKAVLDIYNFTHEHGTDKNVVVVATRADDTASLTVLAPMSAMTIAEYFRDQGQNVLVILDDLTNHARFYREISLLAKRFPGRESYPGDIFYLHARLLERAGNFKKPEGGEVSITCLPVAEMVNDDLTSYIVSNLISITDGHLLFDAILFSKGQRPAIDHTLSITRVGRQTQSKLAKKMHQKISDLLTKHKQAQNYTQFGAELSADLKEVLNKGNKLLIFFSQPPYLTLSLNAQMVLVGILLDGWLENEPDEAVGQWRDRIVAHTSGNDTLGLIFEEICDAKDLDEFFIKLNLQKELLLKTCQTEIVSLKKSK